MQLILSLSIANSLDYLKTIPKHISTIHHRPNISIKFVNKRGMHFGKRRLSVMLLSRI